MEGDVEELDARLRELKRRGANVLILTDPSSSRVCTRLLGADATTRRRLFVRTHGGAVTATDPTPDRFGLVDVVSDGTRTSLTDAPSDVVVPSGDGSVAPTHPDESHEPTANEQAASDAPDWFSRVDPSAPLSTVAEHVHVHLTRFETHDPSAGEVRLCFDSLDSLVNDVARKLLLRFLLVVTTRVQTARGIGHYHLASSVDPDLRGELEAVFDATVETRSTVGGPQQRWLLHQWDLETDWLTLEK